MIPHERELVERLEDRPFTLLGIVSDRDPDEFRAKCSETGVNWPNGFEGEYPGRIAAEWGVMFWPTIYVLDHRGVIRFKNIRGEELDAAVDQLLAEIK